jgi:hypothetical protein
VFVRCCSGQAEFDSDTRSFINKPFHGQQLVPDNDDPQQFVKSFPGPQGSGLQVLWRMTKCRVPEPPSSTRS